MVCLFSGQHSYQATFQCGLETLASTPPPSSRSTTEQREANATVFDHALGENLELLGAGFGLSESLAVYVSIWRQDSQDNRGKSLKSFLCFLFSLAKKEEMRNACLGGKDVISYP